MRHQGGYGWNSTNSLQLGHVFMPLKHNFSARANVPNCLLPAHDDADKTIVNRFSWRTTRNFFYLISSSIYSDLYLQVSGYKNVQYILLQKPCVGNVTFCMVGVELGFNTIGIFAIGSCVTFMRRGEHLCLQFHAFLCFSNKMFWFESGQALFLFMTSSRVGLTYRCTL